MNSAPENERWIICPVCYQPNPEGTQYCKYCWGAVIHAGEPVPYEEAKKISRRKLSARKRRKVIKITATILIPLLVVFFSVSSFTDIVYKPHQDVNSNSLPGEWAMFRHDLSRSGSTGSSATLPQGTLKWTFSTGSAIHSSPAIAYDTVYFGSRDGKLYALDAATGTKRWEYQTGSWVESSPAIVNGVVYVGSNDGKLYAIDAYTGKNIWAFQTRYPVISSPAVANGIVYFGADDSHIYALDAATGKTLWAFETEGPVTSSPIVANGIIYNGSGGKFGYALNALNGRFRLRFKLYYPILSSPAVSDETIYFLNSGSYLFAVDGNAKTWPREHEIFPYWMQVWLMGTPGVPPPPPQSGFLWGLSKVGNVATSSPVVTSDALYLGTDNKILAFDLQSHERRWEFETEGLISSSPAVADTTIYVASEDGRLYAVDATTGEKLWDITTGDKITSSPAVADGTVYIGSHDGNLYAIK